VADQNQTSNSSASTGSPWDEPLDIPEEEEKKKVIGTLEDTPVSATDELQQATDNKPVPFNIPEGVDEEKVGKKIPAGELVQKEKDQLKMPDQPQKSVPLLNTNISPDTLPPKEVNPAGQPVENTSKEPTVANSVEAQAPVKPAVDNIAKTPTPASAPSPASVPAGTASAPGSDIDKIKQNIATMPSVDKAAEEAKPAEQPAMVDNASTTEGAGVPTESIRGKKPGILSKINIFSKNKKAPTTPKPLSQPTVAPAPAVPTPQISAVPRKAKKPIKIDFYKKSGFIGTVSVILIFIAVTFLTENGIVSLGFEKVYGIVGLEKLWGGLPRNPEAALAQAFVNGQDNLEFKAKGEITMTVDKTIKSPITSPLVAVADFMYLARDTQMGVRTKAMLAQADYYYDDDYYEYDYDDTTSSSDTTSDSTTDSSTADSSDTSSQEDYQSYSTDTSTIKEINSDFESISSADGTKTDFTINKITGRNSSVSMITSQNDLYVNTSSDIEFNAKAENNKWLDYSLSAPDSENVLNDIYSLKTDSGFSIIGRRIANEKVSDMRCYRYQIDSLELGSSLEFLGIESEMVQKISGDVWIGIKDKLIHKIDVTLIPSISSSVSRIDLEVEFYDYGSGNSIEIPRLDSKIAISGSEEAEVSEEAIEETTTITSTESSRDTSRKTDLASIKSALSEYYSDNGYYPVSSNWSDINQASSQIVSKLVPEYLSAIPVDPKSAEGFYYGYKSDGKTFTLSARFENLNDPQITQFGDIWLHYVYSDN